MLLCVIIESAFSGLLSREQVQLIRFPWILSSCYIACGQDARTVMGFFECIDTLALYFSPSSLFLNYFFKAYMYKECMLSWRPFQLKISSFCLIILLFHASLKPHFII